MFWMCSCLCCLFVFFFFKQKTAYEMRISDWSSDVCSSDLYDEAKSLLFTSGGRKIDQLLINQTSRIGGNQIDDYLEMVRYQGWISDQTIGHNKRAQQRNEREKGVERYHGCHQIDVVPSAVDPYPPCNLAPCSYCEGRSGRAHV